MTGVINDPLGQTHSSVRLLFSLEICLFCETLKSGDGRTPCAKIASWINKDRNHL